MASLARFVVGIILTSATSVAGAAGLAYDYAGNDGNSVELAKDNANLSPYITHGWYALHEDTDCKKIFSDYHAQFVEADRQKIYYTFLLLCDAPEQPERRLMINMGVEAIGEANLPALQQYVESHQHKQFHGIDVQLDEVLGLSSTFWLKTLKITGPDDDSHRELLREDRSRVFYRSIAYYDSYVNKTLENGFADNKLDNYLDLFKLLFDEGSMTRYRDGVLKAANYVDGSFDAAIITKDGKQVPAYTHALFAGAKTKLDCRKYASATCTDR